MQSTPPPVVPARDEAVAEVEAVKTPILEEEEEIVVQEEIIIVLVENGQHQDMKTSRQETKNIVLIIIPTADPHFSVQIP